MIPYSSQVNEVTEANIGTTAEICSIKEDDDNRSGISDITVKAIGRQRFKVKEKWRTSNGWVLRCFPIGARILQNIVPKYV